MPAPCSAARISSGLRPAAFALTSLRKASHWQDLAGLVWGKACLLGFCAIGAGFYQLKVLLASVGYAQAAITFIVCTCYALAVFLTPDSRPFPCACPLHWQNHASGLLCGATSRRRPQAGGQSRSRAARWHGLVQEPRTCKAVSNQQRVAK